MSFTVRAVLGVFLLLPFLVESTECNENPGPGPGVAHNEVGGNGSTVWPWQIYKSSSFTPPVMDITTNGKPLAPGYIVTTQSDFSAVPAIKAPAPLIMTDTGELVWNGPILNATNLFVQTYENQQVLHYWSGLSTAGGNVGHGYGNVTILDTSYNVIATVCPHVELNIPGNQTFDCIVDIHESFLTDRNTMLVSVYNATPIDLSPIGGPVHGWGFDCLFLEVDPKTNDVLFTWSAQDHVPITHTHQPRNGAGANESFPFDWFHINSVVNIGDNYLVNGRHTWETYLVDSKGNIIWTINGDTGGDFGLLPEDAHFRWQHHSRPHNVSNSSVSISWFNNNNQAFDNGTNPTVGLELLLPLPPSNLSSASVQTIRHLVDAKDNLYVDSQGSYEVDLYGTGNGFITYGEIPVMKEFGPDTSGADVRWTGRVGGDNLVQLYRGYKQIWHGNPTGKPSLVVEKNNATDCPAAYGYVSWNGATDVTAWAVYEGSSSGNLTKAGDVGFKGFETKFNVDADARYVQVAAVVNGTETTKSEVQRLGI
ncbi:hypothetical protein EV356DRAFT_446480 [Viridothelium virens]|uniref:ASST-domain-containing protein n=1 Tax=Viridothelium virens TaxID=1048519 RepID=A0A6A6H913_VIRVR|nr:hypothetical protein EV356DRAFT_446480 [Viridothelium virens]